MSVKSGFLRKRIVSVCYTYQLIIDDTLNNKSHKNTYKNSVAKAVLDLNIYQQHLVWLFFSRVTVEILKNV